MSANSGPWANLQVRRPSPLPCKISVLVISMGIVAPDLQSSARALNYHPLSGLGEAKSGPTASPTLRDMRNLALARRILPTLNALHLRIYGPTDLDDRLAGLSGPLTYRSVRRGEVVSDIKLSERLRASGLSHNQIAIHLGTSRSFVTKILNGAKPWPPDRRDAAVQLIESNVVNTEV